MRKREKVEKRMEQPSGDAPAKSGRRPLAVRFLVSYWLP